MVLRFSDDERREQFISSKTVSFNAEIFNLVILSDLVSFIVNLMIFTKQLWQHC